MDINDIRNYIKTCYIDQIKNVSDSVKIWYVIKCDNYWTTNLENLTVTKNNRG